MTEKSLQPLQQNAFVDVKYNAKKIVSFINKTELKGIIEIGAKMV